jgi:hypothetical protein
MDWIPFLFELWLAMAASLIGMVTALERWDYLESKTPLSPFFILVTIACMTHYLRS